jgi:hypothetical protein
MMRVIWNLDPFIGEMYLSGVYMEELQPFIEKRRKDGVKAKTINLSLEVVRRILRLAGNCGRPATPNGQGARPFAVLPKIERPDTRAIGARFGNLEMFARIANALDTLQVPV